MWLPINVFKKYNTLLTYTCIGARAIIARVDRGVPKLYTYLCWKTHCQSAGLFMYSWYLHISKLTSVQSLCNSTRHSEFPRCCNNTLNPVGNGPCISWPQQTHLPYGIRIATQPSCSHIHKTTRLLFYCFRLVGSEYQINSVRSRWLSGLWHDNWME